MKTIKYITTVVLIVATLCSCEQKQKTERAVPLSKIELDSYIDSINYILGHRSGELCLQFLQAAKIDNDENNQKVVRDGFIAGLKQDSVSVSISSIAAILEKMREEAKDEKQAKE
ncbi:MAG: hypothetical protein MJZ33_08525 [Paludibacteraceae bacterium]|nr:hypothetical protein [Paludibacteraceae bacterium]